MYLFLECLTVLGLVAVVAMLLFAGCVVLMAAAQGMAAIWRTVRKTAGPATDQEAALSLAGEAQFENLGTLAQ